MLGLDTETIVGVSALLVGLGGGVGLIAFTEKQGEATEGRANALPCVECTGRLVVDCTICQGSGEASFFRALARPSLPAPTRPRPPPVCSHR